MASNSEIGHAKNVANFQDLITVVESYGPLYNPSRTSLTLAQLIALHTTATASLQNVTNLKNAYDDVVNTRAAAFKQLAPLSTRLVNALQATDASKETIKDAKGYNRKIQGKRAPKKEKPLDPNQPAPRKNSANQQSFDMLIQHFEGLITLLGSEPSYAPNEIDLQIATLQARAQDLNNKNNQEAIAAAPLSNARIERNKILYTEKTGLVPIAFDAKKYVKSVFGANSPEYNLIKGIKFKKFKI